MEYGDFSGIVSDDSCAVYFNSPLMGASTIISRNLSLDVSVAFLWRSWPRR